MTCLVTCPPTSSLADTCLVLGSSRVSPLYQVTRGEGEPDTSHSSLAPWPSVNGNSVRGFCRRSINSVPFLCPIFPGSIVTCPTLSTSGPTKKWIERRKLRRAFLSASSTHRGRWRGCWRGRDGPHRLRRTTGSHRPWPGSAGSESDRSHHTRPYKCQLMSIVEGINV